MSKMRIATRGVAALVMVSMVAAGCAAGGSAALKRADEELLRGNLDVAIAYYQGVLLDDPGNTEAQISLSLIKLQSSQKHQKQGTEFAAAGYYKQAALELGLALRLDPTNETAVQEFARIQQQLAAIQSTELAFLTPIQQAIEQAPSAQSVLPQLETTVSGPISLDFRDAAVFEIYRTLAQIGGVNVAFEPTLVDDTTSFQVTEVGFESALRLLTVSNGHFYKVLSPNTFMVIADDVTKRRQYADQVLRTFFLSNADAATVEQQIRALLLTRMITSDPKRNTITIRDTPAAIDIAQGFIEKADKPLAEVLLEFEVLEVSREVVANYGLALEPFQGFFSISPAATDDAPRLGLSLEMLGSLTSAEIFVTVPTLFYQFLRTTNDFKLVAHPKLRATEGQVTQLLIGKQVPVVTTTFNPQATIGGNIVPVSSTEYRDTGILLSVRPRMHFNGEISLELEISISAVTGTATIASVGDLPVFTTRRFKGNIRMRYGQTSIIAGLLQDTDTSSRRGVIGLDQVPVAGDVLSNTQSTLNQIDLVISITPNLLRAATIGIDDLTPTYVGTETGIAGGGGRGAAAASRSPEAITPIVVALMPAEHAVQIGDEFAVDVTVASVVDLFSVGLAIRFDPDVVAYVDDFEGGFMNRGGAQIAIQSSSGAPGIQRFGMARINVTEGVSGTGSLVTMIFRAVAEGTTNIEIASSALRSSDGSPFAVEVRNARVVISRRE